MPKAWANKSGFNYLILHFYIRGKLDIYETIHDFLVWLKTGFNPADINLFRSHAGNNILFYLTGHFDL